MTTTTRRIRKAAATTTITAEPAKPKRTRKAPATPVTEPAKAEHGRRGEHLEHHGAVLDGELAGYVVGLAVEHLKRARPGGSHWRASVISSSRKAASAARR